MTLDFQDIEKWEAGEIALVTLIAFLLILLFIILICIIHYGRIYYKLREYEDKPAYLMDGDGAFTGTARPNYRPEESSDSDDEEEMDEEHNINMANTAIRKSFGAGPMIQHQGTKLMRYHTNTNASGSTELSSVIKDLEDGSTSSSDSMEDSHEETQQYKQHLHAHHHRHHRHHASAMHHSHDEDDEDSDLQTGGELHPQRPQYRQYNYIGHAPVPYQGGYGNALMQQQHLQTLSHQAPPPPAPGSGVFTMMSTHDGPEPANANVIGLANRASRHSKSGTGMTMTSLTSVTTTEQVDRSSNNTKNVGTYFANQHPIDDHLQKYAYTPSDKNQQD